MEALLFLNNIMQLFEVLSAMGRRSCWGILHMVFVLWGLGCALWKNPETEILGQLKMCESKGSYERAIGGGEKPKLLRVQRMFFQRLTVVLEEDRKRAQVIGTLDLDGVWGILDSKKEQYIRSLGFERVEFVYEGGRWEATEGCFPRLEAVLWFLSEQEGQEAEGEAPGTLGWNIRLEREGARISQEIERVRQEGGGASGWRSFFLRRGADGKLQRADIP